MVAHRQEMQGISISKTPLPHYSGAERSGSGGRAAGWFQMSKDELVIQLVKVALGILVAGYFLWWSLEVLKRVPLSH
jgi:hypothetical protein